MQEKGLNFEPKFTTGLGVVQARESMNQAYANLIFHQPYLYTTDMYASDAKSVNCGRQKQQVLLLYRDSYK